MESNEVIVVIPTFTGQEIKRAPHERDSLWMFRFAFLPMHNRLLPLIAILSMGVGAFSLLWNPDYYIFQPVFWSAHTMIMVPAFLYLWRIRVTFRNFIGVPIRPSYRWITMIFYGLFMAYWAYFCWVALDEHKSDGLVMQIGHAFMSYVWYIFFSVSSVVYYYTATLLLQRVVSIKKHIVDLSSQTTKEHFFAFYDDEFEKNRQIANNWNIIILLVILILTLNIPADLLGILVNNKLVVIPGLIMKSAGLAWYLLCICKLNYMEQYILNHLHRHHILQDDYDEITRYMEVRRLGLNFFGLRITYNLIMKLAMIGLNVIVPILYGLFSNHILKI